MKKNPKEQRRNHRKTDRAICIIAQGAKTARLRAYSKSGDRLDLDAARTYDKALKLLSTIHFRTFAQTTCRSFYPDPPKP